MKNEISFVVIGFGHIGKRHAEMILKNPSSNVVAVVDVKDKENLNTKLKGLRGLSSGPANSSRSFSSRFRLLSSRVATCELAAERRELSFFSCKSSDSDKKSSLKQTNRK